MALRADHLNGFNGAEYDAENIYQEITEDRFVVPSKKDVYLMDERIYHEPHIPMAGTHHASRAAENLYSVCCVSNPNPPIATVNINVQGRDFPPTGQCQSQSRLIGLASPELQRARKTMPHHLDPGKCPPSSQTQDGNVLRCEHCTYCLLDFKRQLIQMINTDNRFAKFPPRMEDNLQLAENLHRVYSQNDRCENCTTHIGQLKQEALIMVQAMQHTQDSLIPILPPQVRNSQNVTGSPPSYQRSNRGQVIRLTTARPSLASCTANPSQMSQEYAEHKARMWGANQKKYGHMNRAIPVGPNGPGGAGERYLNFTDPAMIPSANASVVDNRGGSSGHPRMSSTSSSAYSSSPSRMGTVNAATSPMSQHSAAASFFARAAQKLSISSKKKKKYQSSEPELPIFPTSYSEVIRNNPPSAPPYLLRTAGRLQTPGVGKVKVMMRIFSPPNNGSHGEHGSLILSVDARKKQVTLHDPSASGYVSATRRTGIVAPKTFAFDAVFPQDDSLTEICSSSLTDIIQGVVNGADGCVFSFGYSRASKSHTMFGKDQSAQTLGLIPCAISWLFRLINEHRDATGARFSVRVSAVEVSGKQETLKDLLADVAQVGTETGVSTAPSVYLREDPICGTQLENQSELRAPTAEQAAYYLDAAIAARSTADEEEVRHSHLLFTLHVYQYRVEKVKSGLPGVAGGRSRLHFIDLGSCSKSKDPNNVSLSLSALGNVILALLNGQRHIPHRDAKIAQLLRDSLGNLSCRTCMIAHVSSAVAQYNETLQVIQLASRIHRMRRRKIKFSSTSSEDSSTDESGRLRRPLRGFRMGTLREDMLYSSSLSDPDYTSSSEQSCDTVIYVGINGHSLSDRELTDNEGPPKAVPLLPRTNPRLPRRTSGSRSSGDEGSASDTGSRSWSVETGRLSINKIYGREPNTQTRIPVMSPTLPHSVNRGDTASPTGNTTPPPPYQMARRANIKQKVPSSKFKALSDSGAVGRHQNSTDGLNFMEQWVDGPGAAIYPDKKNAELWIDGPQAFMVKMENGSRRHVRRELEENGRGRSWAASKRRNGNLSDGDVQPQRSASLQRDEREEEQWVDGPGRGNIRVSNNNYQNKQNTAAAHSKKAVSHIPQPAPASPPEPTPPPSTVTIGTQSVESHMRQNKHGQDNPRPDSSLSADSLSAEPSDSRPVSLHSNEQSQQENERNVSNQPVAAENENGLNNFVTDWLKRHHCNNNNTNNSHSEVDKQENPPITSNGISNIGTISESENQAINSFESFSNYNKEIINSQTNQVTAILNKTKISPQVSSIGQAQSTNRVTEWLKTVSMDEDGELCLGGSGKSGSNKSLHITEAQLKDGALSFETANSKADWRRNEGLPIIDSVSELISDQCGDNKVWFTEEELNSEQKYLSFYSSADTNKDSNPDTEFANLLISNRESIYEIQVDQQLERRSVTGGQDIPDDETFSSISCAKEDAEKLSLEAEAERIQTVQKLKALNAYPEDIPPVREPRTHCQFDRSKLSDLEEVSDEDSVLECKQQLLVNTGMIDNSSNSQLSKEIFDEEEGAIDVSLLKQNYTINPTISSIYQTNSLYYERNSDGTNSNSGPGAVGGHLPTNVNTVPNTLPMYSQIKPAKDLSGTSSLNDLKKSQKTKPSKSGSSQKTQSPSPPTVQKLTNRNQSKDNLNTGIKQKSSNNNKDISPGCTAISSSVQGKLSASPSSSSSSSHASRGKDRGNKSGRSSSQPAALGSTRNKASKSQSPSRSRLPIFNGKPFAPASKTKKKDKEKEKKEEKKEKEKMAVMEKTCSPKIHEIDMRITGRNSDTGNDTGLAPGEKKFLSPYATVTKPRVASHSSSGHGSDNSSTISTEVHSQLGSKSDKLHGGGTSSGYESMLRDSEATGSSSPHDDSASESSSNERKKGTRKKKVPGSRRSRSCPARSTSESPSVGRKECAGGQQVPPSPSSKAWVDTRQIHRLKEEPLEIRMYDSEDVERMQRRRQDEIEVYEQRRERVLELLNKQEELNQEQLVTAKDRLMIERSNWTFDCKSLLCFSCRRARKTDV